MCRFAPDPIWVSRVKGKVPETRRDISLVVAFPSLAPCLPSTFNRNINRRLPPPHHPTPTIRNGGYISFSSQNPPWWNSAISESTEMRTGKIAPPFPGKAMTIGERADHTSISKQSRDVKPLHKFEITHLKTMETFQRVSAGIVTGEVFTLEQY